MACAWRCATALWLRVSEQEGLKAPAPVTLKAPAPVTGEGGAAMKKHKRSPHAHPPVLPAR